MNIVSCNFWKNKRVLVTGYEGFLGSNLTKTLLDSGARVVGLDIKVKRKETILAKQDFAKITVIKGSVADYKLIRNILKRYQTSIIFHLAAEAIVGRAQKDPLTTFETNIRGTWNILEASRQSKNIEAIVVASSDKAYGSHDRLPYTENTPLRGNHPYDVSKSCADLIVYAYFNTYRLSVAVTRCGNIYGPGDFNFSRVAPDAIRCALKGKQFIIRSDGKFTRDYICVEDVVNGYILLVEKMKKLKLYGEAFNFSNENPITVIEIVKKIYDLTGKKPNYKISNEVRHEIKHQYLSSRKARKILGWKPQYHLKEGLKATVSWYKSFFETHKDYY